MVAVHMLTAVVQRETSKLRLLKQLRDAGATIATMPGSLEIEGEQDEAALRELVAAGTVREARPGLYYLDKDPAKLAKPGNGFLALVAALVLISIMASVVAIAMTSR